MINVFVKGRLGNQMFQYAAARGIQKRYYPDEQINMNFKFVIKDGAKKHESGWNNQLCGFRLNKSLVFDERIGLDAGQLILLGVYFVAFKTIKLLSKKDKYYFKKKKLEQKIQKFYNKRGLYLYSYGYYDFMPSKKKNKLMIGYFESSKFFDNVRDELKEEFMPKEDRISNTKFYHNATKKDSVCVSVRRGDFYTDGNADDCAVCDKDYFEDAIYKMKKMVKNSNFVFFSDDIRWVRKNIDFGGVNAVFESGRDSVYDKMMAMSSCDHFIISNSSFSWWAQYLSDNRDKTVISPKIWRRYNANLYKDAYEKEWILV